jgi:hypothetical protein
MNRIAASILLASAFACHKHEDSARPEATATATPTPVDSSVVASSAPSAVASASASPSPSASVVQFGMIGLLNDTGDASSRGNIWGDKIGESFGAGGLGLSGVGEGAADGGRGEGIGLGNIGTIGHGAGTGTGQGFGGGQGRLGGSHGTPPPKIRQGTTTVNGRLPPEVIQRIVRQNFGRFRLCYENGLRDNPRLTGTVATKFVIDTKGAVTSAGRDASTTLPDANVVSCITRAFMNLSFPQPESGIVTVAYPLIFEPGD